MRILVVRESGGFGDVLCTLFAVRGLRLKYPDAEISYFCMPPFDALLRRFPDINRVIPMGRSDADVPVRVRTRRRYMGESFDPGRYGFRKAYDLIVDCWCPADRHERATGGVLERSRIECFCAAAGVECPPVPAFPVPDADRAWARRTLGQFVPDNRPFALLQIRSAKVTKNWPAGHYERLTALLREAGLAMLSIAQEGPAIPGLNFAMGFSHAQVLALAAESDVVIAPDSGIFHAAAFVGTPCAALFGPTDPRQYLAHYPAARFLWAPTIAARVGCRMPCLTYAENGFPPGGKFCQAEGECMAEIQSEQVLRLVRAMLTMERIKGNRPAPLKLSALAEEVALAPQAAAERAGVPAMMDARTHVTPVTEIPAHVFHRLFGDGYAPPYAGMDKDRIPPAFRAIVALARTLKPNRVLEIGVRYGSTASLLLRECPWIEEYWGVDCPPTHPMGNAIQQGENPGAEAGKYVSDPRFQLHVLPHGSADLDRRSCGKFDLIFIDGDHSLRGVWRDTQLAREVIAPDGVILWHDYKPGTWCQTDKVIRFMNRRECGHILLLEGTDLCMEFHRGSTLLKPETTDVVIPDSPKQFNSAVIDCAGEYLFCMRRTRTVGGKLAFAFLDRDLKAASPTLCADTLVGEDPRLCNVGPRYGRGQRHFVAFSTGIPHEDPATHRCMALAEVALDYPRAIKVLSWARLRFDGSARSGEQAGGYPHMEKNWLPFDFNGRLLLVYQMNPHVICELQGELAGMGGDIPVREICRTATDRWPLGLIVHGGAPPVFLAGQNAYLGIMHAGWRHANNAQEFRWNVNQFDAAQGAYSAGAYLMEPEPPFRITHSSVEPIIFGELFPETGYTHDYPESLGTIFPTGIIIRGDEAFISYGENDQKTRVARLNVKELLDTLLPLS